MALTTSTPSATIRYTINGSTPSASNGSVYTGPITIASTTNLRAVAIRTGYLSVPESHCWTYVFVNDVLTQSNNGVAPAGWPASWGANVVDYGIDPDVISVRRCPTNQRRVVGNSVLVYHNGLE